MMMHAVRKTYNTSRILSTVSSRYYSIYYLRRFLVCCTRVAMLDPLAGLFSIALPLVAVLLISGCQSYIDHGDTSHDPDDIFHNSRNRTSPLATALWFGANYHLEHHLYPGVLCYRLPKLHKLLKESGIYEQVQVLTEPSFLRAYGQLASDYTAGKKDSSFDPLKVATESASSF